MKLKTMTTQDKRLTAIICTVAFLLLIPFLAMQFTAEVNWGPSDFLIMGGLLLGTGLTCEFILRRVTGMQQRLATCAIVLAAMLLIWAELAVGIFGSPIAGS